MRNMARSRNSTLRYKAAALSAGGMLVVGLSVGIEPQASAVAPGCTTAKPTNVSGHVYSYPHGYSLNTEVGFAFTDSQGNSVYADGSPNNGGGYAVVDNFNPTFPNYGDPADGGLRTFGICVAANVVKAWIEMYPLAPGHVKDKTYFGGAADEGDSVTAGGSYSITMREPEDTTTTGPTGDPYSNATGYVNGYISYNGGPIPTADLKVTTFPNDGGAVCGIQGFAGSVDQLQISNDGTKDFYRVNALAGGQCTAPYQTYIIWVTCFNVCGSSKVVWKEAANIVTDKGIRVDFVK
jgi:hypothetical protein